MGTSLESRLHDLCATRRRIVLIVTGERYQLSHDASRKADLAIARQSIERITTRRTGLLQLDLPAWSTVQSAQFRNLAFPAPMLGRRLCIARPTSLLLASSRPRNSSSKADERPQGCET